MSKKRYSHLIWDFNGTILNDVEASLQSANALLRAHGLKELTSFEEYRSKFGFPVMDYYRRLGFDFERTPYEVLAPEWVAYYLQYSKANTLYPQIRETLAAIRARGIRQILLSATEQSMLQQQLGELDLTEDFDEILGQSSIHAHGKVALAQHWRKQNPGAQILLVGDTAHDAEVADQIGADCLLLTCGHHAAQTLLACRPLAVLDDAGQILTYLPS